MILRVQYVAHEVISPNPIYYYEDIKRFADWLRQLFLEFFPKDFVVSARFNDGQIDEIMVGYKIDNLVQEMEQTLIKKYNGLPYRGYVNIPLNDLYLKITGECYPL